MGLIGSYKSKNKVIKMQWMVENGGWKSVTIITMASYCWVIMTYNNLISFNCCHKEQTNHFYSDRAIFLQMCLELMSELAPAKSQHSISNFLFFYNV